MTDKRIQDYEEITERPKTNLNSSWKNIIPQIDEIVFMKSIRDDFTLLGKLTVFPLMLISGLIMFIFLVSPLLVVRLIKKIPLNGIGYVSNIHYRLLKLFIRNPQRIQ